MLIGFMSCFVKPTSSKSRGRDGSDERSGGSIARVAAAPLPAPIGLTELGDEDLALVGALCYKARPLPPAAAEGL